jgi:hypothetical protein
MLRDWSELPQHPWVKKAMLGLLAGIVSIVAVNFVGDVTIYAPNYIRVREKLHERIIRNQPPERGWSVISENGENIRIAIPYLVDSIHSVTRISISQLYKVVDLIGIWFGLVIFSLYLRRWFTVWESALACLYFAAMLPLTFAYHYYHPYDRASFVTWLLAIWCARSKRFWEFSAVIVVAVLIKYDAIILPLLYFLGNSTRQTWRQCLMQCGTIEIILLAIFIALLALLPGGFEFRQHEHGVEILRNMEMIIRKSIFYAPSLAFGLPVALAILGYTRSDHFARTSVWFAGLIIGILFVATRFEEVRAEQMLFPLLAPAALLGLRRILGDPSTSEK